MVFRWGIIAPTKSETCIDKSQLLSKYAADRWVRPVPVSVNLPCRAIITLQMFLGKGLETIRRRSLRCFGDYRMQ
jgi:hypothetical protein